MGDLMSTIKANDLTNTTGGIPTVKGQRLIPTAWVNFDGTAVGSTSGTVAIRDSENVSSITDNGVGDYTANFSTAMANANYAPSFNSATGSLNTYIHITDFGTPATGSIQFKTKYHNSSSDTGSGTAADYAYISVIILGGQA
jgi:hypothetical protein